MSDLDYQFLAKSEALDRREMRQRLEADRLQEMQARLAQEERSTRFQRLLLDAILVQYSETLASEQQARVSEIQALLLSAEGLFASHRQLEALLQVIKAA